MKINIHHAAALLLLAAIPVSALEPKVQKLHSPTKQSPANNNFGASVAMSEKYTLIAERGYDDKFTNAGAVHVHDTKTGKHLRSLIASDAAAGMILGEDIALSGELAVVGHTADNTLGNSAGAVYVFDLGTGRQLRKITAGDGAANHFFGADIAIRGDLALISAPGINSFAGAVYLFNVRTGQQIGARMTASDAAPNFFFGGSLAFNGRLALIGSSGNSGAGASSGAAYLFDALTGAQISKLTAFDAAAGDFFGTSVAITGHYAFVGAYFDDDGANGAGSVYGYDLRTGLNVGKFVPPSPEASGNFGAQVAADGNLLLVAAPGEGAGFGRAHLYSVPDGVHLATMSVPDLHVDDNFTNDIALAHGYAVMGSFGDDDLATSSGAAYLYAIQPARFSLEPVTQTGTFAPDAPQTTFSAFTSAFINNDAETAFGGTLAGSGSTGGRNKGVWSQLASPLLKKSVRTKDALDVLGMNFVGTHVNSLLTPIINRDATLLVQGTIQGTNVSSQNNSVLFTHDGTNLSSILRTGSALALHPGTSLMKMVEIADSTLSDVVGVRYDLRKNIGGVTSGNDSGVVLLSHAGLQSTANAREGAATPLGGSFGQVNARVAVDCTNSTFAAFGAPVIPTSGNLVPGLFQAAFSGAVSTIVDGSSVPPGAIANARYSTFLGESYNAALLFHRTTLKALPGTTDVKASNNEAIFRENTHLISRKGDELLTGVRISRFLQFAGVTSSSEVLMLVQLTGTGVSAANDVALLHHQANGTMRILLREGEFVDADDAARVGTIQRVDIEPLNGRFVVLASLTGNAKRNLGLFTGVLSEGNDTTLYTRREPRLVMRKGTLFFLPEGNAMSPLRSISLPITHDASGAGNKGLRRIINSTGSMVMTAEFDNRSRILFKGKP